MNAGQKADAAAVLERARLRAIRRAEAAEVRLAEVERALERDRGPGVVGAEGSHEELAIREALAILKRVRGSGPSVR